MNKLNEMDIASLSEEDIEQLKQYETKINQINQGKGDQEIFLLALSK